MSFSTFGALWFWPIAYAAAAAISPTFFFFGWWIYWAFPNGPWITGPLLTEAPWNQIGRVDLRVLPMITGVSYLLSAEISLSLWAFYWLVRFVRPDGMGGGDVKLAAALALWFSPASAVKFLVVMSLAGGVLTLFVVALHRMRGKSGRPEIPYGVAIAFGGLVILTQRFLNQFA